MFSHTFQTKNHAEILKDKYISEEMKGAESVSATPKYVESAYLNSIHDKPDYYGRLTGLGMCPACEPLLPQKPRATSDRSRKERQK